MPEVKEKLESQGMQLLISTPEQFSAQLEAETAKYGKVIRIASITQVVAR